MTQHFGWVDRPADVADAMALMPMPVFASAAPHLKHSGDKKTVLAWKAFESVMGKPFPVYEQEIGDCTSWGAIIAAQNLACTQSLVNKAETLPGELATEPVYAASRVEIGGGRIGTEDGSLGAWVAKALTDYGTLLRKKYGNIDLTTYSGNRAREWGMPNKGMPDEIEPQSRQNPVRTASLVRTWEEVCDGFANGYQVFVCSSVGFKDQSSRDRNGFLRPNGRWDHCMPIIGVIQDSQRPAAVIYNQWGRWLSGPRPYDIPECSFLAAPEVINTILRQGDSWMVSGYVGFPAQQLPETWLC